MITDDANKKLNDLLSRLKEQEKVQREKARREEREKRDEQREKEDESRQSSPMMRSLARDKERRKQEEQQDRERREQQRKQFQPFRRDDIPAEAKSPKTPTQPQKEKPAGTPPPQFAKADIPQPQQFAQPPKQPDIPTDRLTTNDVDRINEEIKSADKKEPTDVEVVIPDDVDIGKNIQRITDYHTNQIMGLRGDVEELRETGESEINTASVPAFVWRNDDNPGGGGLDWSTISLGYEIDPNGDDPDEVRIYAGEIDRIAVTQTDVIPQDDWYVYVRRTLADDTMLVTTAATVPADDATYRYYRLYRFTVTDEVATIQNIYRPFDIEDQIGDELPSGGGVNYYLTKNGSGTVIWDYVRWY